MYIYVLCKVQVCNGKNEQKVKQKKEEEREKVAITHSTMQVVECSTPMSSGSHLHFLNTIYS